MKKRVIAMLTVMALAGTMLVGCGSKKDETEAPKTEVQTEASATTEAPAGTEAPTEATTEA